MCLFGAGSKIWFVLIMLSFLFGCKSLQNIKTEAETNSGYTYIPLDPLPINIEESKECSTTNANKGAIYALPDNAVRMSVQTIDGSGNVTYGSSKAGVTIGKYQVIVDYIMSDVTSFPVKITKSAYSKNLKKIEYVNPLTTLSDDKYDLNTVTYSVFKDNSNDDSNQTTK